MNISKTLSAGLLGLGLLAALPVQATVLSSYLTFEGGQHTVPGSDTAPVNQGGGEDALIDDSLSVFVDNGATGFDIGDIIWGVVSISEADASLKPSIGIGSVDQLAFVFSVEIISAGTNGGDWALGAITDNTSAYYLGNLLDASVQGTALDSDTIAVGVSTTNNDTPATNDPLNQDANDILNSLFFTNANNWFYEMTLGLVEDTDFFDFDTAAGVEVGVEIGMFSIQDEAFAVDEWVPVDTTDFTTTNPFAPNAVITGDFAFSGSVNFASTEQEANNWTFADDSRALVNPHNVPEPGMLALIGIGFAGLGFSRRKVRNA